MITFVKTKSGLQVYNAKGEPFSVSTNHPFYKQLSQMVLNSDATFEEFDRMLKAKEEETILSQFIIVNGNLKIERVDGKMKVWYKDLELPQSLTRRFIKTFVANIADADQDIEALFNGEEIAESVTPIINFVEKLLQNPSRSAVSELFDFLEVCSLPITSDGSFLAYKKVKYNHFDIHSGTFDNSVGKTLKMERWQVDEDRRKTCSEGFHCCSFEYLDHFGSANKDSHRIVIVKVNPKDVVAVPADYANQKMRVCEYTVVDEIPGACHSKLNPWYIPNCLEGRLGELMDMVVLTLSTIGSSMNISFLSDMVENGFNFDEEIILPLVASKKFFNSMRVVLGEMTINTDYLDFQEFIDDDYGLTIQNVINFIAERVS